jgi:hypothetical protein
MSKQAKAKESQGFSKKSPTCSNCIHFCLDKEEKQSAWSMQTFTHETNLRCGLGGFKVGKTNWCNMHQSTQTS